MKRITTVTLYEDNAPELLSATLALKQETALKRVSKALTLDYFLFLFRKYGTTDAIEWSQQHVPDAN